MSLRQTEAAAFSVQVEREDDHWKVTVNDQAGQEYAITRGPTLDVTLHMAVPYMAYAAEPDPFAELHRRAVAAAGKPRL